MKLFQGKLPQKVIEPVENTDPPPGTSKKIISACKISSSGRCLMFDKWVNRDSGTSIKFSSGSFDALDCANRVIFLIDVRCESIWSNSKPAAPLPLKPKSPIWSSFIPSKTQSNFESKHFRL